MKKLLLILSFILLFVVSGMAGDGYLYIVDSGQTLGSTDIDTCYDYSQNCVRPWLDHWLEYYTTYDIDGFTDIGDYISFDSLCNFDGIIISPFMGTLIQDDFQDSIAVAVEDSGVGLFNLDPNMFEFETSLFNIIPVSYYNNNQVFTNTTNTIVCMRDDWWAGVKPTHWVNRYAGDGDQMTLCNVDSMGAGTPYTSALERYYAVDSIGDYVNTADSTGLEGPTHPRLEPLLVRVAGSWQTRTPILFIGSSESGLGKVFTVSSFPDYLYSAISVNGNMFGRANSVAAILTQSLAYVARDGVVLKLLDNYGLMLWNNTPPTQVASTDEFLEQNLVESIIGRSIPITFRIETHPVSAYTDDELEYFRSLQNDYGCDFLLRLLRNNGGVGWNLWVDHFVNHGTPDTAYYREHRDTTFKMLADSVEDFIARSDLKFANGISTSEYGMGDSTEGSPVYRWRKMMGMWRHHRCGGAKIQYLPIYPDSISQYDYRAGRYTWLPDPFGTNNFMEDYIDTTHGEGFYFKYSSLEHALKGMNFLTWDYPDSCRLEKALIYMKSRFVIGLGGAGVSGVEIYPNLIANICHPDSDSQSDSYTSDDMGISHRWDSLLTDFLKYAKKCEVNWEEPAMHVADMVDNKNLYTISNYSLDSNILMVTLTGATYAPTEFTLYYGEGGPKERLPIRVPVFGGTLDMNIRIIKDGFKGYHAEIY